MPLWIAVKLFQTAELYYSISGDRMQDLKKIFRTCCLLSFFLIYTDLGFLKIPNKVQMYKTTIGLTQNTAKLCKNRQKFSVELAYY